MAGHPVPRRVALVVHPTRPVGRALETLTTWAGEHGVDVVQLAADGDRHRELAAPGDIEDCDLVVAVGGDGTVLAALRRSSASRAGAWGR